MEIINLGNFAVNNFILPISNGYMLIDTCYENGYKIFRKNILKYNIKLENIKYIFLTHAHDDHAGFLNKLLLENQKIKVIMHSNAKEGLFRGQNSFNGGCTNKLALLFCKIMAFAGKKEHKFLIVEKIFENNFIFIGSNEAKEIENNFSMQFIETIGHTNCSISLLWNNNLFCGDAAMNGLPSWNRITIWAENLNNFKLSWDKIIKLNPIKIYPGHGTPFRINDLIKYKPKIEKRKLYKLK